MTAEACLVVAISLPALGAIIIACLGHWPDVREAATLVTAVLSFINMIVLASSVGLRPEIDLISMFPGLSLSLHLEPLGLVFGLVASGLWIATSVYAIGYMRGHHEVHQTRFFACFAIAISAALGVALAKNLLTLFLFYEVLTISTYPLVTHHGTDLARRAGRVYLGILISTSVAFLLMGIVLTWGITGTLDFKQGGILREAIEERQLTWTVPWLLALFAFGIGKAALMPFHRWLPAAMVAPTPVSALLHAVAVVKAGVFSVLKVSVYIFGTDYLRETQASTWLMYAAGATILIASLVALNKDNLKERLAYSTISQLSYIVLGAALANEFGVIGGGMHIAMHAVGKITLFFCAGAIYVAAHKTQVSQLDGLGRRMPLTMAAFGLGAISVIGLPPFGGAWSKWFLALGAAEAHQLPLMAVLMISSLLNIAYLMPIPIRAFFLPAQESDLSHVDPSKSRPIQEAPMACVVPLCVTGVGCIVLFFAAEPLHDLLMTLNTTNQ